MADVHGLGLEGAAGERERSVCGGGRGEGGHAGRGASRRGRAVAVRVESRPGLGALVLTARRRVEGAAPEAVCVSSSSDGIGR